MQDLRIASSAGGDVDDAFHVTRTADTFMRVGDSLEGLEAFVARLHHVPAPVHVELCAFSLIGITYCQAPPEIEAVVLDRARKIGHSTTDPVARLVVGGPRRRFAAASS